MELFSLSSCFNISCTHAQYSSTVLQSLMFRIPLLAVSDATLSNFEVREVIFSKSIFLWFASWLEDAYSCILPNTDFRNMLTVTLEGGINRNHSDSLRNSQLSTLHWLMV